MRNENKGQTFGSFGINVSVREVVGDLGRPSWMKRKPFPQSRRLPKDWAEMAPKMTRRQAIIHYRSSQLTVDKWEVRSGIKCLRVRGPGPGLKAAMEKRKRLRKGFGSSMMNTKW